MQEGRRLNVSSSVFLIDIFRLCVPAKQTPIHTSRRSQKTEAADILSRHLPGTNPADRCLPIGIPAAGLVSELNEIVQ
jgi:hypothetical protein